MPDVWDKALSWNCLLRACALVMHVHVLAHIAHVSVCIQFDSALCVHYIFTSVYSVSIGAAGSAILIQEAGGEDPVSLSGEEPSRRRAYDAPVRTQERKENSKDVGERKCQA